MGKKKHKHTFVGEENNFSLTVNEGSQGGGSLNASTMLQGLEGIVGKEAHLKLSAAFTKLEGDVALLWAEVVNLKKSLDAPIFKVASATPQEESSNAGSGTVTNQG